jgi:pyruvate dehydrogenase E2 component (dihydrolipoamide acetyltransferase)
MHATADAREIQALRAKLKDSPEALRLRDVTINDMVLFAVARSLLEHPDVNAHFIGGVLRRFATVHLGFAVDTPRGLMVPVIRGAQALTLREIAAEKARLARGCREGGVTPEELGGGTFTVTNLGAYGVQGFTPVLNVPQVAILGVGAIMPGPLLGPDGSVGFVPQITLSLTINHQVVDGAPGARFLQTVSGNIARFELLLAG